MANQCKSLKEKTLQEIHPNSVGFLVTGEPSHPVKRPATPSDIDRALEEKLEGPLIENVLTKRERQILEYIIDGKTNKEIAQKLYRTQRTVEYHRNRLMRKLNTHTTAELVKRAIRMGLA